jgi:uncharacterized protein (TIGR02996 family)
VFVVEINGPEADSRRAQIDGAEATIGRHPSNDVQLQRSNVSKRHARIVRRDDTIIIVDLKSTNGTYVNGRKITSPQVIVRDRDTIYIGDYRIVIHIEDLEQTAERPLPPYLARDPVEHRLLTEIAARDDAARVVYADWLEERGDHERAEFLRLQQQIVVRSPDDPGFEPLTSRLRALAATLDIPWRIRVARPAVEHCPVAFELQCPKEWGKLELTDRDGVRYCGSCKKTVHYAATVADARRHAQRGNCVAIDVAGIRWGRDLEAPYGRFVCQKCNLDVGPGPLECPRCQASIRRPIMMGGMVAPSR